jgi:hypothetical protein
VSEDTDEADIRRGLRVYARAAQSILEGFAPDGAKRSDDTHQKD